MKLEKAFYVGHSPVLESTHLKTLAEAIASGKELVETGTKDFAIVVKIVRVIKRKQPPVTVEVVR